MDYPPLCVSASSLGTGASRRTQLHVVSRWLLISVMILTAKVSGQIFAPELITFQDFIGTTDNSTPGYLKRSAATDATPAWTADAISRKWIYGDGWVEFSFDQVDKSLAVGFVQGNPDRNWINFGYSIKVTATSSSFGFYETGTQVGPRVNGQTGALITNATFGVTDRFRIERSGGIVTFVHKSSTGLVLHTYQSATPCDGIRFVDTSIVTKDSSISNCQYYGADAPEDVLWINNVGTAGSYDDASMGSKISKNVATSAWDSDAVSSKAILDDGLLRFRVGQTTKSLAIGLSTANPDRGTGSLNYSFVAAGSTISVYESGALKTLYDQNNQPFTSMTYTTNDVFTIRRVRSQITYEKNGIILGTTNNATAASLFADCSFYSNGGALTNCQIEGYPLAETPAFTGASYTTTLGSAGATLTSTAANGGALTVGMIPGDGSTAFSGQSFLNNGTLTFSFGQSTGKNVEVGLTTNRTTNPPTAASINYGIRGGSNGKYEIVEGGTGRGVFRDYTTGDQFEIRRVGGVIEYVQNHAVVDVRTANVSAGPLSGAALFTESGGSIKNVVWYNGETDLLWRRPTNSNPDWSSTSNGILARNSLSPNWNADASGYRQLIGDGYIQWKFSNPGKDALVGLASSDRTNDRSNIDYGIWGNGANGVIKLWLNGAVASGTYGAFTSADTFRIRRTGTTIRFSKIDSSGTETALGSPVTLSAVSPLVVDCSLYDITVTINSCRIAFNDSDADGLDDWWEQAEFASLGQPASGANADFDGDTADNIHEFYNGTDAADFYNGHPAQLNYISGDGQFSDLNSFLGSALVVEVRNPAQPGTPTMANVPVKFNVQSGGGFLATQPGSSNLFSSITVWTDSSGRAQAYYKQPNTHGTESVIRAQAGANDGLSNAIDFHAHTHMLRGWWKLDELSGTDALDSSPSSPSNKGTLQNAPSRELSFKDVGTGVDRAVRFNSAYSQYISVPHVASQGNPSTLEFTGAEFSVTAWVKLDKYLPLAGTGDVYAIASKWSATGGGFEFAIKGGTTNGLSFRTMTNGQTAQEVWPTSDQRAKLTNGLPHFVAYTRDSVNGGRLYIDGLLVSSVVSMPGSLYTTADLYIGKSSNGHSFSGAMDEVKILTSPLRSDEIQASFDSDGDSLPNWWEIKYGFDPNVANNTSVDSDGDGVSDGNEYLSGRNPHSGTFQQGDAGLVVYTHLE